MEKVEGVVMGVKNIVRGYSATIIIFLLLASCQGGNTLPANVNATLTATQTALLYMETGTHTETFTPSPSPISETPIQTLTPTRIPPTLEIKDWQEPIDVITPENINRVEKIGELDFSENVSEMNWSPDGSWLGVNTRHSNIFILDASTFAFKWLLSGQFVAFSHDGMLLETGVYQYDLSTGEAIHEGYNLSPNDILDLEFSPDGKYLASGGTYIAHIYSLDPGIEGGGFGRKGNETIHISVSPESDIVAINYSYEVFTELWDPYLREPIRMLKLKGISGKGKPRFTMDGKSLFFTGQGIWEEKETTFLQEWDYHTGKPFYVTPLPVRVIDEFITMDISPSSSVIAFGTNDGDLYLMPMRDCRFWKVADETGKKKWITSVAFRPDGKIVSTLGPDGNSVSLWGIPASEGNSETHIPTISKIETPSVCPRIPMIIEIPKPETDWFRVENP